MAPTPSPACCDHDAADGVCLGARQRLGDLDSHVHCSVIGTCLSTAELRKLMGRFIDVVGASDLDVHHEAVRLTSQNAEVARTLHKALDRRHEGVVQRFSRAKDESTLASLWDDTLRSGEIPGAYWALLTHRRITPDLRQKAFGDVHMLSHLVGAANRADIKRLMALEHENAELRERMERAHDRTQELVAEREQAVSERDAARTKALCLENLASEALVDGDRASELQALRSAVALHAQRREAAETLAEACRQDVARLEEMLAHLRALSFELTRELCAVEAQLQTIADPQADRQQSIEVALNGKRVLYVGGRPSSTPAIRDLVLRSGGDFRRHDGGLEDRKGLLAAGVAWADMVVFPVDCVDHDSALALKRDCLKQGRPFVALRTASVGSFIAAMNAPQGQPGDHGPPRNGLCIRHA